jgi:hypothetical protein
VSTRRRCRRCLASLFWTFFCVAFFLFLFFSFLLWNAFIMKLLVALRLQGPKPLRFAICCKAWWSLVNFLAYRD